jgi:hypothetical protein
MYNGGATIAPPVEHVALHSHLEKMKLPGKIKKPENNHSASYYRESFVVGRHNVNIPFKVLTWP